MKALVSFASKVPFQIGAAFLIVGGAMIFTALGKDSFIKDVGLIAAGFLFAKASPAPQAPEVKK